MFKSVIIWGGISFLWQFIAGIILPRIFIFELGSNGYGKLSFFLILLNPIFWFDFTGDINKGLLAVLPNLDFKSQQNEIRKKYSATLIWWLILWVIVIGFAGYSQIDFFSGITLTGLLFLPFFITGMYWVVINWFSTQQYTNIYRFQTAVSVIWLMGCWILINFFPVKDSIIYASLGVSLFCFFYRFYALKSQPIYIFQVFNLKKFKYEIALYLSSGKFQSLFLIQALLGLFVLQIDRLIIASYLSWDWVAFYFVPIGILFKFPALLAVFNRPMLAQIAYLSQNKKALKHYFFLIIPGTFCISIMGITPSYHLIKPLVSIWITPTFAQQASIAIQLVFQILPFAILLMFAQSFLIALNRAKTANYIGIAIAALHWVGTAVGISLFGEKGIGAGFFAESLGALVMIWMLSNLILTRREKHCFFLIGISLLTLLVAIIFIQFNLAEVITPSIQIIIIVLQFLGVSLTSYYLWKNRRYENSNFMAFLR